MSDPAGYDLKSALGALVLVFVCAVSCSSSDDDEQPCPGCVWQMAGAQGGPPGAPVGGEPGPSGGGTGGA